MRFVFLFLFTLSGSFSFSQACGPNFWSQEDIDSFPSDFPGCTILNDLWFDSDVTNLDSLYAVTKIEGDLIDHFNNNINFNGLSNVDTIVGDLNIEGEGIMSSLTYVGGDFFSGGEFPVLNYIGGNSQFFDITASFLEYIGGDLYIDGDCSLQLLDSINGNLSLGHDNSSSNFPSLKTINGNLFGYNVQSVNFPLLNFINGHIDMNNYAGGGASNLFNELDSVNGDIEIYHWQGVDVTFNCFNNLKKVENIDLDLRSNLSGFNQLTSAESLRVDLNGRTLSNSFDNLDNVNGWISLNYCSISEFPFVSLISVDELRIDRTSIESLLDMNPNLTIGSSLIIEYNNSLTSLDGLLASHVEDLEQIRLRNNSNLSVCNFDHICDLLDSSVELTISNNSDGCKNIEQLENRCAESGIPPANDLCADAITLTLSAESECTSNTTIYTTNTARMHQESFCVSSFGEEVFFKFTPTESMAHSISLSDFTKDMGMELYTGDCGDVSILQCGYTSINRYFKADTTYIISVFCDIPTEFTDFKICVTETELIGDADGFGVNVLAPLQDLHIDGAVLIGNTNLDYAGSIRFTGTKFEGFNGFEWVQLDNSGNTIGFQDTGGSDDTSTAVAREAQSTEIELLKKENQELKARLEALEKRLTSILDIKD